MGRMSAESLTAAVRQAEACERQGRFAEAAALYRQVLAQRPTNAFVWNLLGAALYHSGESPAALAAYERSIELDPSKPEPHYNLGNALRSLGDSRRAREELQRAADLRPSDARLQHKLGCVLLEQGEIAAASDVFERTLQLAPNHVDALANLGSCRLQLGQFDEARHCLAKATAVDPKSVVAWNNFGSLLLRQKQWSDAEHCFRRALEISPQQAEAHNNLGAACEGRGDLAAAEAGYRAAIAVRPNYATALYNLGNVLQSQGQFDLAAHHYDLALAIRPGYPEAEFQRGTLRMLHGDLRGGYAGFARRWEMPAARHLKRQFTAPAWKGESLRGQNILLYAEQGYGDLLQFVRFARLVSERGGKVILECRPEIVPLMRTAPGIERVISTGETPPPFAVQAALMDVPAILNLTVEQIPAVVPYLAADADRVEHWRRKLATFSGLKVGVVWQGSPTYRFDAARSIPLNELAPLAAVPGVNLVSLQKGVGSEQTAGFPLHRLPADFDAAGAAFVDTAAVMMNLDLVITSDTAIAHLAGALGRPVWIALGTAPDWRWFLDRDDSPWYPTAKLFRQKNAGDWPEVFGRIARELLQLVERK